MSDDYRFHEFDRSHVYGGEDALNTNTLTTRCTSRAKRAVRKLGYVPRTLLYAALAFLISSACGACNGCNCPAGQTLGGSATQTLTLPQVTVTNNATSYVAMIPGFTYEVAAAGGQMCYGSTCAGTGGTNTQAPSSGGCSGAWRVSGQNQGALCGQVESHGVLLGTPQCFQGSYPLYLTFFASTVAPDPTLTLFSNLPAGASGVKGTLFANLTASAPFPQCVPIDAGVPVIAPPDCSKRVKPATCGGNKAYCCVNADCCNNAPCNSIAGETYGYCDE
jgi:hypothetical protein